MRVIDSCAKCLLDRQIEKANRSHHPENREEFIRQVKELLVNRKEEDSAPYLVSLFNELYEKYFGEVANFREIKKEYNDLVLSMEEDLEAKILGTGAKGTDTEDYRQEDENKAALARAILYARVGNYIDFGAMNHVDKGTFLKLFDDAVFREEDGKTFEKFYKECGQAKNFLLITDNCGEIVLDKLFLRILKRCFPELSVKVLVRGKEVLNDATMEDAIYVGMEKEAKVIPNGTAVAGTIYEMITEEAKQAMDEADVVLAKGQGNYESMAGLGRHVYYAFLCKCELFTTRFGVPLLTGMFVAE